MHRLFLADADKAGAEFEIEGREAHHALHVLRARAQDVITILDGRGGEYVCEIQTAGRHSLGLRIKERKVSQRASYEVTLFQALPKGKAFESILQKATELGAFRIVPLFTERVVAKAEKQDKWQWVMIDAMKQCGNPWMPLLEEPQELGAAVQRASDFDLSLVGSLHEGRRHPREWFEREGLRTVSVWVGPEGDFTAGEMEALMQAGVKPMSLGPLVLRSDTAAVAALAIINHELEFACTATKKL